MLSYLTHIKCTDTRYDNINIKFKTNNAFQTIHFILVYFRYNITVKKYIEHIYKVSTSQFITKGQEFHDVIV